MADKISSTLSGVSGEYFVAAELSRRGYLASITLRNTESIDVLASSRDGKKQVAIQVKTNQRTGTSWLLNEKAEIANSDSLFYVFINLNNGNPEFFVVPSKIVSNFTKGSHSNWLKTPGKKGQPHKNTSMRKFEDKNREYQNRWELLGLD